MGDDPYAAAAPVVIDRADGVNGELILRAAGPHFEIISNGVFLMDTRAGTSERLLVDAALSGLRGPAARTSTTGTTGTTGTDGTDGTDGTTGAAPGGRSVHLLIGGLGMGFSLAAALSRPQVTVTVVEIEPAVIAWHHGPLKDLTGGALDDPRVRVECADLLEGLRTGTDRYDAICLDIDNGPDWTVTQANGRLYTADGLGLLRRRLRPGGVVAFWSAAASAPFEHRLRDTFTDVAVHSVAVPRGEPDVVYLAWAPSGG